MRLSPQTTHRILVALILAVVGGALLWHGLYRAKAATSTVTNLNDHGPGSLRQALLDADASPGLAITFASNLSGTINLESGLNLNSSASVTGPGANRLTVRRSTGFYRVLAIGQNAVAQISGLTLSNGGDDAVGGLYNSGNLTLSDCVISGNTGTDASGIYNDGVMVVDKCTISKNSNASNSIRNNGTLTITNSTISDNVSPADATIRNNSTGQLNITSSTITGNKILVSGGSFSGGGVANYGNVVLVNDTISNNTSGDNGGGVNNRGGTATIINSTIAGNFAKTGGGINNRSVCSVRGTIVAGNTADTSPDVSGAFTTLKANLIGNTSGSSGFSGNRDLLGVDPKLDPTGLQDNGGPTKTIRLRPGSPAIDPAAATTGGNTSDTPATDQRGFGRLGQADIGAYESQFAVTNNNDSGAGSLRQAIIDAEASAGSNGIDFKLPSYPATIQLQSALPIIHQDIALLGPGANLLTIRGQGATNPSSIFIIEVFDSQRSFLFKGLTISGGYTGDGGGILFSTSGSDLSVTACVISGNSTVRDAVINQIPGRGGGVFFSGRSLAISNSTISGNTSNGNGGGLYVNSATSVSLTNTTFSNNLAGLNGGGIYSEPNLAASPGSLNHLTVTENSAPLGGGIFQLNGLIRIHNSIIAWNIGSGSACPDVAGSFTSEGFNLIGDATCGSGFGGTDKLNQAPMLGPLQDNGGQTPTRALLTGSPALDAGDPANVGDTDQRGFQRVGQPDIGAYEQQLFVTNTNDSGPGSLRQALLDSNATGGGSSIDFKIISGTIQLLTQLPCLCDSVDIRGPGASLVTVRHQSIQARLLYVAKGVTVKISGLTLSNGFASQGSAIYSEGGSLTLTNSAVTNNLGGSAIESTTGGSLTINSSTVSGNQAEGVNSVEALSIDSSTISGNGNDGVANQLGPVTIRNSTISGNLGDGVDFGLGNLNIASSTITGNKFNGVVNRGSPNVLPHTSIFILNSIVAGNLHQPFFGDPTYDVLGLIISQGNNIFGTTTGGGFAGSDSLNQDPGLGPLQANGGPTQTHALLAISPAIDAGNNSGAPLTDQRGYVRVGTVDIGAYERQFIVVNNNDSGAGSLRQAIINSNNTPGTNRIDFNTTGIIQLQSGLVLSDTVEIPGPGSGLLTVRGSGTSSVFTINPGATVTLSGLTISNGHSVDGGGIHSDGNLTLSNCIVTGNSASNTAGGIFSTGVLTITGSTISNNNAVAGGSGINNTGTLVITNGVVSGNTGASNGGGISNSGTFTITNSTISGNSGTTGGGISNSSTLTITNSTISGNTVGSNGGGISSSGTLTVTNSTISGNSAGANSGGIELTAGSLTLSSSTISNNTATSGSGGGIHRSAGTTALLNNIIAGNTGPSGRDLSGAFTSQGYNLVGNASGFSFSGITTGNLVGVANPALGPLANNGGPTQTQALLTGSPALNAGSNAGAPLTDQRGQPRIFGLTIDMGAYEQNDFVVGDSGNFFTITTLGDDLGEASLRQAITTANSRTGQQIIYFSPELAGEVHLHTALPALTNNINIVGPGANRVTVRRDFQTNFRVFTINVGANVTISGLSISQGITNGEGPDGGGINNGGTLTVDKCNIVFNRATDGANGLGRGGGIYNAGVMILKDSAVYGNTALNGGGIYNALELTVVNSTIIGNSASFNGGGINFALGHANIVNTTIANNSAARGGGLFNQITTPNQNLSLRNTIVNGNTSTVVIGNDTQQISGFINSLGNNLIDVDARLGGLLYEDGPTVNLALLAGSPAIDAGNNCVLNQSCADHNLPFNLSTDQRNVIRPVNGIVDIGALENSITLIPTTLPGGLLGTFYNQTITPSGGITPYTLSLTGGLPSGVTFSPPTGVLSGTPTTNGIFFPFVSATDVTSIVGTAGYKLIVCGAITISPATLPLGQQGVAYSTTLSASGAIAPASFTLTSGALPSGFSLSPGGVLSSATTPASGNYNFTITATDAGGCTGSRAYSFRINGRTSIAPQSIDISQGSLPFRGFLATVNDPEDAENTLSVKINGAATATVNGVTISNISVDASGVVTADTGTSCTATAANFTLSVTDSDGLSNTAQLSVTVSANTPPSFSYGGPFSGIIHQPQTINTTTASDNGGSISSFALVAASSNYPAGVVVNVATTTGAVSIPDPKGGTYLIAVRATDACGTFRDVTFTVVINCPQITVNPSSLGSMTIGTNFSQNLSASGGTPNYSFIVSGGTLPTGLTLATNGQLSGMPTAGGRFIFTVTATDADNCTGSRSYTVDIPCPSINLTPTSLPNSNEAAAYDQTLTAHGGTAPYSFARTGGTLPPGLTLALDGRLSGTTTTAGNYNFTVTATDAFGCSGSQSYSVLISAAPNISVAAVSQNRGSQGVKTIAQVSDDIDPAGSLNVKVNGLAAATVGGVTISNINVNVSGQVSASVAVNCNPVPDAGSVTFTLTVTDSGGIPRSTPLVVTLLANVPPALSYGPTQAILVSGSRNIIPLSVSDPGGSVAVTLMSISPNTFTGTLTIDNLTGAVAVNNAAPAGDYNVTVRATDNCGATTDVGFLLRVYAQTVAGCPTVSLSPAIKPAITFSSGIASGDFNRDGAPDLVVTSATALTSQATVMYNKGNGEFTNAPPYSVSFGVGERPDKVVVGDFNRDGWDDIATLNFVGNSVDIRFNDGAGGFPVSLASGFPTGNSPRDITVGDFNHDGAPDVAVANSGNNTVSVRINDGSGQFPDSLSFVITDPDGKQPQSVQSGDFNHDGWLDLVIASTDDDLNGSLRVWLNDGAGHFPPTSQSSLDLGTGFVFEPYVTVADLNLDGWLDVAIEGAFPPFAVKFFLNDGAGGFPTRRVSPGYQGQVSFIRVSDLNGDGKPDFILGHNVKGQVSVMTGDGTGNFAPPVYFDVGPFPSTAVVADLNMDGSLDLATSSNQGNSVVIRMNDCSVNQKPTITAETIAMLTTHTVNDVKIAHVHDQEDPSETLKVRVEYGDTAQINNVQVSNIRVDTNGDVWADFVVYCHPSDAAFTLTVHDRGVLGGTAILHAPVTGGDDPPPAYPAATVPLNGSVLITPEGSPYNPITSVSSLTLDAVPAGQHFTGTITVNSEGVISITNAGPLGHQSGVVNVNTVCFFTSVPFAFDVVCPTISLSPNPLPAAAIGVAYSQALTANGGQPNYSFSVTAGGLPNGLSLSTAGVLIGTPTANGVFTFTITATDAHGCTGSQTYTLRLSSAPTIQPAPPVSRQEGTAGSAAVVARVSDAEDPVNALVVKINGAATATVNGVTVSIVNVNSGTGDVTANVQAGCGATNALLTLTVTDTDGIATALPLAVSVTLNTPPVLSYPNGPHNVVSGGSLTVNPTGASDNVAIASFSLVDASNTFTGTVVVNNATGAVSIANAGPPGSYSVTVRATDNCGASTAASFTLNVSCPNITLDQSVLPGANVGIAYSKSLTVGGSSSYTFAVAGGALPPGFTFSSTGQLSGSTATSGSYNFSVSATDANGCAGIANYTLAVTCPNITLDPGTLPAVNRAAAYALSITASGGTAPYSFAVTSGSLAAGLSLSTGGQLTGAPTAGGTFAFTITATDANGCSIAVPYTLLVNSAPVASAVAVTGTHAVGQLLTGSYTFSDVDSDVQGTSTFRWLRNGAPISDAVAQTYTTVAADADTSIAFEVTPIAQTGTNPGDPVSSSIFVPNSAPIASAVSITGVPTFNSPLTGQYTYSDLESDAQGASAFRWLRNGVAIDAATATTYTVAIADIGQSLTFEVTPIASAGSLIGAPVTSLPVTIGKADQTIVFNALANKNSGDADFVVSATASSGLAVGFAASGSCTLTSNTVHLTGMGSCTITASQSGDANYNAAPDVSQTFTITAALATHLLVSAPSLATSGTSFSITVTALDQSNQTAIGYSGPVHFTSDDGLAVLPTDAALINGVGVFNATLVSSGSYTITATDTASTSINGTSGTISVTGAASYVEASGNCGVGHTPCFTSLQGAIAAANDNDIVNVVGGTFIESVSLDKNVTLNINADTTINDLTISNGIINGGVATLTLSAGNWANNGGAFNAGSGTVSFVGSGQAIGGSNPTTFNNLIIGSGGTTVSTTPADSGTAALAVTPVDVTVVGELTLNGDFTVLSPAKVIMLRGATSAGNGDLIGSVMRTNGAAPLAANVDLTFGNPNNIIRFDAAGAIPTDVTINLDKNPPATLPGAVKRTYTISQNNGNGFVATLQLHYQDGDLNGNIENSISLWRFNSSLGQWQNVGASSRDTTNNWVRKTGVTDFSIWSFRFAAAPTAADGTVSGQILDSAGNPVEGATVQLSGTQKRMTITDANGNYHFDNVETSGFYTVVPTRPNFTFSPSARSFSQLGSHTEAIFTGFSEGGVLNPLDTTGYFVRQQYLDFLNREPDEAGFNFWVNKIEACGTDVRCREAQRIGTSAAFFLSIEFQETGYLVYRTYKASYGDVPGLPVPLRLAEFKSDAQMLAPRVNQDGSQSLLENNKQALMTDFVQRARFTSLYPVTMSPAEFIDKLFANAEVTPADSDRAAAINEFGTATTIADAAARARALRSVAESQIVFHQCFNQAFVLMEYYGYLRRDPFEGPEQSNDFNGYNFWLTKLNEFNGNFQEAELVKAFLTSIEYRSRFPR
jgi:predicted outer membrane repeat protein